MIKLTLYSKPECSLCEKMKTTVNNVAKIIPLSVEEIDITNDPQLEKGYSEKIPLLLYFGEELAMYKVSEEKLIQKLKTVIGNS